MTEKTHYRKAFNSPYLSSADIVGEVTLTIDGVALEPDKTKKTKDLFNTAYFVEKSLRDGEVLKPMILNSTNSKMIRTITDSPWIEDWQNVKVCVYVDRNVKMMGETVEGLRIKPAKQREEITPDNKKRWGQAKDAYIRDGNLDKVLTKADMTQENQDRLIKECEAGATE